MNEKTWNRIKDVFHQAIQRPDADLDSFLAKACAGSSVVRSEVEDLLAAHREIGELQTANATLRAGQTHETAGETIGRYKLLQRIGEGGFGVVYMAEQEEPIRRRVALKIIKLGMDTKEVVARFEAERQALAILDHANIAKVFDGGATENGRPYFVMELVKGVPITEYCDQNNLSTRQRLHLFVEVCDAVQHAHQKGIIHRDIKPNNVMVTLHDGKAMPKVIDFGVAKATHQRLTEKTLFTAYGHFIGTPAYMSPEQAEMSGLDIDTRSDIYSLGVLLYELLTGTTPFDPEALRSAAYAEIQRILKEDEPLKPSARLTTLGRSLTDVARHRRTDPSGLARLVRGDLDWIVMKALEKDRSRRYGSASELAADVARHWSHEPVVARPPSRSYRLRKLVAKHRVEAAAALAIVTTIMVLGSLSMWFGLRARLSAERMRASAVVATAAATSDPLLKAQLILEVADRPDTPGLLSAARQAANSPLPIAVFKGHERSLVDVTFDPAGTRLATSSRDGTVRVWSLASSSDPIVLRGYRFGMRKATFSPDGRYLAAGSNGGLYIWRADGIGEPVVLEGGDYSCACDFAFRHDSSRVLVIAADNTGAHVWSIAGTGSPVELPAPRDTQVGRVAFSPDGSHVALGLGNGAVQVWREDGSGLPFLLRGHDGAVSALAFSPDGRQLLTGSEDGTARVWLVDGSEEPIVFVHEAGLREVLWGPAGEMVMTVTRDNTGRMWRLDRPDEPPVVREAAYMAINPDGWRGATASENSARIWASRAEFVTLLGHEQEVRGLTFSPDGSLLATIGENTARLWHVNDSGESLDLEGPEAIVTSAALSPDGARVVTGLEDGIAHVRRIDGVGEPFVLRGHRGPIHNVAFSLDGARVLTHSVDQTARVWRADGTGEPRAFSDAQSVAISPDGTSVAIVSQNAVRLWPTDETSEPLELMPPRLKREKVADGEVEVEVQIRALAFTPDGSYLVADAMTQDEGAHGSEDSALLFVWPLKEPGDPVVLRGHVHGLTDLDFSADARRMLTSSTDGTARVWPIYQTGKPVVFESHLDEVLAAAFSPDGQLAITASTDASARIWRTHNGEELAVLRGHERWVTGVDFSPDGARVVTASPWDRTARVWRSDGTGTPLVMRHHEFRKHLPGITRVEAFFTNDGSRVLTVGVGTARVWRVSARALLDYLRETVKVCLAPEERIMYLAESPSEARAAFTACRDRLGRPASNLTRSARPDRPDVGS